MINICNFSKLVLAHADTKHNTSKKIEVRDAMETEFFFLHLHFLSLHARENERFSWNDSSFFSFFFSVSLYTFTVGLDLKKKL